MLRGRESGSRNTYAFEVIYRILDIFFPNLRTVGMVLDSHTDGIQTPYVLCIGYGYLVDYLRNETAVHKVMDCTDGIVSMTELLIVQARADLKAACTYFRSCVLCSSPLIAAMITRMPSKTTPTAVMTSPASFTSLSALVACSLKLMPPRKLLSALNPNFNSRAASEPSWRPY